MQKTPFVFPIIGGRKVEHMMANIEALNISLTEDHIRELESAAPFNPGWPMAYAVRPFLLFHAEHYPYARTFQGQRVATYYTINVCCGIRAAFAPSALQADEGAGC